MGLLRGTNELMSAKWLELTWHIVSAKLTVGIKLRDAVERSVSSGTWDTYHREGIVYAAPSAEEQLSANVPGFEPQKRICITCGGPYRQEVERLWGIEQGPLDQRRP